MVKDEGAMDGQDEVRSEVEDEASAGSGKYDGMTGEICGGAVMLWCWKYEAMRQHSKVRRGR